MLQKELAENALTFQKTHCNWTPNCEKYAIKGSGNKCPETQVIQKIQGKNQIQCLAVQWEGTNDEIRQF